MSARERVLGNIRRSLRRVGPVPASVAAGLDARLSSPQANLQPAMAGDRVEGFVARVQAVSGVVSRVSGPAEVSGVVEAHVTRHALPADLVVAPDPDLDDIAWSNVFKVERRAATGADQTSVTGAFAGIAETGSLMLLSGPRSPTTLNFLPEDHLIVVRASRIVGYLEDAFTLLREESPAIPRTVNLITGPSKTGDVEQTIQEGAHGPRRFHVILIEDR